MTLIQAGFPNSTVRTLNGASRVMLARFKKGGPRTARVESQDKHFVLEVTTCSRERRRKR